MFKDVFFQGMGMHLHPKTNMAMENHHVEEIHVQTVGFSIVMLAVRDVTANSRDMSLGT